MRIPELLKIFLVWGGLAVAANSQNSVSSAYREESSNTQVLQGVFCEVEEVAGIDPAVQMKLQRIGGGFTVMTLATLFDRDGESDRIIKQKKLWQPGDDFVLSPPSSVALRMLSEIVKNPPTGGPTYNREQDRAKIKIWKKWISENAAQIRDMQPNGEGVTFTKEACQEWRRSPIPR